MMQRLKRLMKRVLGRPPELPPADQGNLPPSFVRYKDYISIHPTAIIAPNAAVQMFNPPEEPRIVLEIGEGCHIFSTFSLIRSEAHIKVGRDCQLGASQFIAASRIDVGDDVLMAWGCTVIDTDTHPLEWQDRQFDVQHGRDAWIQTDGQDIGRFHDWSKIAMSDVSIGSKSWIGFNVAVLKGVHIGEGAIVGAQSVVTRNIDAWSKAAGNPCRQLSMDVER